MKAPTSENTEEIIAASISVFFLPGEMILYSVFRTYFVSEPAAAETANEEADHVHADDEGHLRPGGGQGVTLGSSSHTMFHSVTSVSSNWKAL